MITVVLTIYNRVEYYKAALDSLANQNDMDFELLIYTNIDIQYDLEKFREVDIVRPQKKEMGYWLADAIIRAKYDKIAFLDDDDTFEASKTAYLNQHDFQYLHNNYNHLTSAAISMEMDSICHVFQLTGRTSQISHLSCKIISAFLRCLIPSFIGIAWRII